MSGEEKSTSSVSTSQTEPVRSTTNVKDTTESRDTSRPYSKDLPLIIQAIGAGTVFGPEPQGPLVKDRTFAEERVPWIRWYHRVYRKYHPEPTPTNTIFYAPVDQLTDHWVTGYNTDLCGKYQKQLRMCHHLVGQPRKELCRDEQDDLSECLNDYKKILRRGYMYEHRVKQNKPFPEDPVIDGYNWHRFKYIS